MNTDKKGRVWLCGLTQSHKRVLSPYLESCQPAHLLWGAEWVLLPITSRPTMGLSTVASVWCIRLGDKDCNQRIQTPICILSSLFQWDSVVTDSWRKSSCFEGGNHCTSEQGSYLTSAARAKPVSIQCIFCSWGSGGCFGLLELLWEWF